MFTVVVVGRIATVSIHVMSASHCVIINVEHANVPQPGTGQTKTTRRVSNTGQPRQVHTDVRRGGTMPFDTSAAFTVPDCHKRHA